MATLTVATDFALHTVRKRISPLTPTDGKADDVDGMFGVFISGYGQVVSGKANGMGCKAEAINPIIFSCYTEPTCFRDVVGRVSLL